MSNRPYENREIDEKFNFIKEKLELIHTQTIKTNGRVNKSEEEIQSLKDWKANLMGKITVISVVASAVWVAISTLIGKRLL